MLARLLLASALAVAAGALPPAAAAEDEFPLCRKKLQLMLGKNLLHLRGRVVDESLIYGIWMDRERWGGLGQEGQDGLARMVRCSVTEGGYDRPFELTVRDAYSNAKMALYEDGRSLPVE